MISPAPLVFICTFMVIPKVGHPYYFKAECGFLTVGLLAYSLQDAGERSRAIVDTLLVETLTDMVKAVNVLPKILEEPFFDKIKAGDVNFKTDWYAVGTITVEEFVEKGFPQCDSPRE